MSPALELLFLPEDALSRTVTASHAVSRYGNIVRQFLVRPVFLSFVLPITLPYRQTPPDTRGEYELGTLDIRSVWPFRAVLSIDLQVGVGGAGAFRAHSVLLLIAASGDRSSADADPLT
jgi:hypothetical protein